MFPPSLSYTHDMATDSRQSTSEIFISRRPKKSRIRTNATGNRDPIILNAPPTSPNSIKPKTSVIAPSKVPVLYYLTRNSHIEHPHLIDVPLACPDGLYLRDVINTLNHHRGKGMANMYSWSIKRSYKNGYVWHDLSEDDLIEVTNGHDYVLKGSELLQTHDPSQNPAGEDTTTAMIRRRNQSWSSFDNPQEYMVVKCESSRELTANFAADAATQTEEQRRRQSFEGRKEHVAVALRRQDLPSPPPSNSSSEEATGARYIDPTVTTDGSGRMKASQILMQLISCGAPSSRLKMQAG